MIVTILLDYLAHTLVLFVMSAKIVYLPFIRYGYWISSASYNVPNLLRHNCILLVYANLTEIKAECLFVSYTTLLIYEAVVRTHVPAITAITV